MRDAFHLWSNDGSLSFLGLLLQNEGYRVTWQPHGPSTDQLLRGYIPRSPPPPSAVVLFDTTGKGAIGDSYRAARHPVIGGNHLDRHMELDRVKGTRLAEQSGIPTPEWHAFTDRRAAEKFLESQDGGWFIKCCGSHEEASTASMPNADGMIRHLRWVHATSPRDLDRFILQRKISGVEIDVDGFFNGREFVQPFFWTLEDKKFLDGDLGPNVGCMASLVGTWKSTLPALIARTIARIEPTLAAANYIGDVACNCMLDDAGEPRFLEWTLRFGFSATQAQCLLLADGTLGAQFGALARGKLDAWELADAPLALVANVSIPPFPTFDEKLVAHTIGRPLDRRLDGTHPRVFPNAVRRGADGRPEAAGGYAVIAEVGARGNSIAALRQEVLRLADDLDVPAKQYRRQLISRYGRVVAALRNFGYDDGVFDDLEADDDGDTTPAEHATAA